MRFFKENSGLIVKLFINQIGIAIFSFMLYTAFGELGSNNPNAPLLIKVAISAFSIIFYFVLLYNIMWEVGGKDKIRIDAGRLEKNASKGLLIGLLANALNIVIIGTALILLWLASLTSVEFFMNFFAVLNAIYRIFIAMFLGVIIGATSFASENVEMYYTLQTVGFLICSLISALVIHLSYVLGLNDVRLFSANGKKRQSK